MGDTRAPICSRSNPCTRVGRLGSSAEARARVHLVDQATETPRWPPTSRHALATMASTMASTSATMASSVGHHVAARNSAGCAASCAPSITGLTTGSSSFESSEKPRMRVRPRRICA
eukprot:scaffold42735_cov57-Phaeocystis_antarctica.AAC.2